VNSSLIFLKFNLSHVYTSPNHGSSVLHHVTHLHSLTHLTHLTHDPWPTVSSTWHELKTNIDHLTTDTDQTWRNNTDHMTMQTIRMTISLSSEKNSHITRDRSPIMPIVMPNAIQKMSTPAWSSHRCTGWLISITCMTSLFKRSLNT